MTDSQDNSRLERGPGRPPFEPTEENRELVLAMTVNGVPAQDVAETLGIAPDTLRKHFAEELDHGRIKANARVAKSLFRQALKAETGDKSAVTAAIFWLKTRAGWREKDDKQEAPAGLSIQVLALMDPDALRVFHAAYVEAQQRAQKLLVEGDAQ